MLLHEHLAMCSALSKALSVRRRCARATDATKKNCAKAASCAMAPSVYYCNFSRKPNMIESDPTYMHAAQTHQSNNLWRPIKTQEESELQRPSMKSTNVNGTTSALADPRMLMLPSQMLWTALDVLLIPENIVSSLIG